MKKIAFVGNGEPPDKLLELFSRFTPGRSGIWRNLQGVNNYRDADVYGVIDWLPSNLGIDETKCIFLGAHPETLRAYRDMSNYRGIAQLDCKREIGFLEWWINYDYDTLMNLQPVQKVKTLSCIMSNANSDLSHTKRKNWLQRFTDRTDLHYVVDGKLNTFDLYGRIVPFTENMKKFYLGPCGSSDARGAALSGGNDHMSGKEDVYLQHKYSLEFDNVGKYYFSERVLDSMLLWDMPIYWGGQGVHLVLPEKSFRYLNIEGNGEDVLRIINSNFYEENLDSLAKARQILLNELQIWPRIHKIVFGES